MSDLFKRNRPKLSEDEERALWERVRTIPREAGGRSPTGEDRKRSPWEVLWARPAVRYGAPTLAVALVAIVWVAQKEPVAPVRQESVQQPAPAEVRAQVESRDAPSAEAPVATPPAVSGSRSNRATPEATPQRRDGAARAPGDEVTARPRLATSPANERLEQRETGVAGGAREAAPAEEGVAGATSGSSSYDMAPPPPATAQAPLRAEATKSGATSLRKEGEAVQVKPQAVKDFYRENPRVGTIRAAGEEAKTDGGGDVLLLVEPDRLHSVMGLAPGETAYETVRLPLTGGTAWVVAARGLDGTLRLAPMRRGHSELVRYAYPEERNQATDLRAFVRPSLETPKVAILVVGPGTGFGARFVRPDGGERTMPAPRTTPRARRVALGVELLLNLRGPDLSALRRVRAEAAKLTAERPDDRGARALLAWCDDMVRQREAAPDE